MTHEIKIPSVGESITSAVISIWHYKSGEHVSVGNVILTLETDKVATEVTSEYDGILETLAEEGTEVKIDEVVATIREDSTAAEAAEPPSDSAAPKPESKPESAPAPAAANLQLAAAGQEGGAVPLTTRQRMSPLRRKIAQQLVNVQREAAILTTFNECDMSAVRETRSRMQEGFQQRHGIKLGFMSFFIKAVVNALQQVPAVNGRIDGEDFIHNHFYDIGVAVGSERGLVVPVIRGADRKSFAEIEKDLVAYAEKARSGTISLEDLRGGVFTISNGGIYGSLMSTPILNPPQSGILGMHAIQDRPVARNGEVVIRPMMYLALSYDHRVVDGSEAVTFLVRVKQAIEDPLQLILQ